MVRVVVGVPTFRRPIGLNRLLTALVGIGGEISVIVAENDPERREGFDLCQTFASQFSNIVIECVIVDQRGISFARNALIQNMLTRSDVSFLAMLDDDEMPERGWLEELLRVQNLTGADIVGGPVFTDFETAPPAWVHGCGAFDALDQETGPINRIEATGNVLIGREVFERMQKPWFDPTFGLTGGGDNEFFMRAKREGCTFAWASHAIARETCPVSRMTLRWILKRAYRTGNTHMRILLIHDKKKALAEIAKALLVFVEAPVGLVMCLGSRARFVRSLRRLWRAGGKMAALFRQHPREYEYTHGC